MNSRPQTSGGEFSGAARSPEFRGSAVVDSLATNCFLAQEQQTAVHVFFPSAERFQHVELRRSCTETQEAGFYGKRGLNLGISTTFATREKQWE